MTPERKAFLADCEAHGIDPDDPKYLTPGTCYKPGEPRCPWCLKHETSAPRARCDLQQAKAALIPGSAPCRLCREPFVGARGNRCPACLEKGKGEAAAIPTRRGRNGTDALYGDDACGCVERVSTTELAMEHGR